MRQALIIAAVILAGIAARADDHAPENIQFNQLIDESQDQQNGLLDKIKSDEPQPKVEVQAKDDSNKDKELVEDFVDSEMTVKKSDVADKKPEHIVNRVYNSVGEPRVATLPEVELIKKHNGAKIKSLAGSAAEEN